MALAAAQPAPRTPSLHYQRGGHAKQRRDVSPRAVKSPQPVRDVVMRPLYLPEQSGATPADRKDTAGAVPSGNGLNGGAWNGAPQRSANGNSSQADSGRGWTSRQNGSTGNGVSPRQRRTGSVQAAEVVSQGQPRVEQAAAAAMGALSQSRTGEILVQAEFEEPEYRDLPSDANFRWAQDSYSKHLRAFDIWTSLAILRTRTWLIDSKWTYPGGFTEARQSQRRRDTAAWLRGTLLDLGPTFVKLGQLFSTRSDLLPPEFTEELALLQDCVPAFSFEKAKNIIEAQLGPLPSLFAFFDERPLAAASLGQVHHARLRDGSEVVVKVQRPGLKELFDIDLEQLGKVAAALDKQDEGRRDLKSIHQECATVLYQEIDYIREGRSADRFRRNFGDTPWVQVPRVYWGATSPRVITLSYMPGIKITNVGQLAAANLDTSLIAKRATEAYLMQILRHGFLHADPHPGNIAVSNSGSLVFYDFGMMSSTAGSREKLLEVFYGIYRQDTSQVVDALVQLGIIVPTADMLSVRRAISYFLQNFQQQTQREETIGAIGEDLFAIALDQPFRFPATFTFVLRAFSTLEGLGKALDPDYSFSQIAKPYAMEELLNLQDAQKAQGFVLERLSQQAQQMGANTMEMPNRIARIDSTLNQLEGGELKLRTRVLESERADRRQAVLQLTTVNAIAVAGLVNVATQFGLAGYAAPAWGASLAAGVFGSFVYAGLRRVKRLDKFEKEVKG